MRLTVLRPLLALTALGALAGCSSIESLMPRPDAATSQLGQGAAPRPVAQTTNNPAEKQIALPVASIDISCPEIEIGEGRSFFRVGGAESASVRHQFNIGETARQCDPAGPGQASIKIGVAGNLIIGPAGSPGTYSVPLRITVIQDADKKQIYSKTYKIEATADATSSGRFRIVADPIVVPMPTLQLANVYSIQVGFEGGGSAAPRAHRRRGPG